MRAAGNNVVGRRPLDGRRVLPLEADIISQSLANCINLRMDQNSLHRDLDQKKYTPFPVVTPKNGSPCSSYHVIGSTF